MNKGRRVLMNQLALAYSPMSNFDFTILKSDKGIQSIVENSNLYVIGQRPELRFDNIEMNEMEKLIEFEIRQHNNKNVLKCKVPIFQENIAKDFTKAVLMNFGSSDRNNDLKRRPIRNIQGMKFYHTKFLPENFLIWFSPEKFLHNYWKGHIIADIKGNIQNFTNYQVHYVGQSTKQDIWKRLTGHDKLQDILSLEYPLAYGTLPSHEIAILLFKFQENLQLYTTGNKSSVKEMVDSFTGKNMPDQRTIYLDAEKALINAMNPKYNDELFKKYPKSSDGLYKHNYDSVSYTFTDPITLKYDKGAIEGGLSPWGGDTLIIKNNESMILFKHE